MTPASHHLATGFETRVEAERKKRNYADFWTPPPVTEPYRVVLSDMRDRLWQTRDALHHCLTDTSLNVRQVGMK